MKRWPDRGSAFSRDRTRLNKPSNPSRISTASRQYHSLTAGGKLIMRRLPGRPPQPAPRSGHCPAVDARSLRKATPAPAPHGGWRRARTADAGQRLAWACARLRPDAASRHRRRPARRPLGRRTPRRSGPRLRSGRVVPPRPDGPQHERGDGRELHSKRALLRTWETSEKLGRLLQGTPHVKHVIRRALTEFLEFVHCFHEFVSPTKERCDLDQVSVLRDRWYFKHIGYCELGRAVF